MNRVPEISIIVATYNQANYICEALESVLSQTVSRESYEVIVINDGSTDQTSEYLHGIKSDIRLIERENRGLVASCNEGLELVRGRYFARMDSDDYVSSNWIEVLLDTVAKCSEFQCVIPDMYELSDCVKRLKKSDVENIYTLEACGTLYRTEAVRAVGGFRALFWEEYDLYLRLQQLGAFVHCPFPLYTYRKHDSNMTGSDAKRTEGWKELIDEWGTDRLKSVGYHSDLYAVIDALEKDNHAQHQNRQ